MSFKFGIPPVLPPRSSNTAPIDLRSLLQATDPSSSNTPLKFDPKWYGSGSGSAVNRQLSSACAGQYDVPNEIRDISIIKDAWLKAKASELTEKEDVGINPIKLQIRVGTFNVNGKLPSQDLSPWVRPRMRQSSSSSMPTLPDIPRISPLSSAIGGVSISKIDDESYFIDEDTVEENKQVENEEPDIMVFGFQELDLSAGAFIYGSGAISTNTAATGTSADKTAVFVKEDRGSDDDLDTDEDAESKVSTVVDTKTQTQTMSAREEAWVNAIFAGLGEMRGAYTKVASKQLVGMLIVLIAKNDLAGQVEDVRSTALGSGFMGIMGNKGATALRVQLTIPSSISSGLPGTKRSPDQSIVMTFVNSHLAAFDDPRYTERRNEEFKYLSEELKFPSASANNPDTKNGWEDDEDEDGYYGIEANVKTDAESITVYKSDFLFWFGDFNYRIDLGDADVRELLSSSEKNREYQRRNIRDMLVHDQLKKAIRGGRAFQNFIEGKITHYPSYRFAAGLATDVLGYDLKRRPAWTDRILHMASPYARVSQLSYSMHPEIKMSDHRPVSANFVAEARTVDSRRYSLALKDLTKEIESLGDDDAAPKLKVIFPDDAQQVEFGEVSYMKPVIKEIRVQNVGKTACAYRFVPIRPEGPIHSPWLTVSSLNGLVLPEETITITFRVFVDNRLAFPLNKTPDSLRDTLILHTMRGKDHFIYVTGEYQPTCLANDLSFLVRLPCPIREASKSKENLLTPKRAVNAPKEAMRLIQWFMSRTEDDVPDLFLKRVNDPLVDEIRECLDTGNEFTFSNEISHRRLAMAFGESILRFLEALPSAIIPASLHQSCVQITNRDEAFAFLMQLPKPSVNVMISLTAFLHYLSQQSNNSSITNADSETTTVDPVVERAEALSQVFAPILLRDDPEREDLASPLDKRRFILCFIS